MNTLKTILLTVTAFSLIACGEGINESLTVAEGQEHSEDFSTVNGSVSVEENGKIIGDIELVNGGVELEDGSQAHNIQTINGRVDIGKNVTLRTVATVNGRVKANDGLTARKIETVNGEVSLSQDSKIKTTVSTVNGLIKLKGVEVGGDVTNYNGGMYLDDGTIVNGDLTVEESEGFSIEFGEETIPVIIIGENVVIKGDLKFERDVELYVHESAKIGNVIGATIEKYSGAQAPNTP